MPDESSDAPPGMRGKIWRAFRAGEGQVGEPLAAWYYVTPRFPAGVSRAALARADEVTHHEVARSWFMSNLRPIDLNTAQAQAITSGGLGISSGGASVLATVQVPRPVDTLQVLTQEFGGAIPEGALRAVATWLGDWWDWIPSTDAADPQTASDVLAAILAHLGPFATRLRSVGPEYAQIGHNSAGEALPITPVERDAGLAAISEFEALLSAPNPPDPARLQAAWSLVAPIAQRFGTWALHLVDLSVTNVVDEGSKAIGKKLPYLAVTGFEIWRHGDAIGSLLDKLAKLHWG